MHQSDHFQPSLSRRALLQLIGTSLLGLAVQSCSASDSSFSYSGNADPAAETVQIVYQDWQTEWFPPMAQHMLEEFHDKHPNIRVFYKPDPDNIADTMLADMQAGTAPDVFQGCCTFFPIWAQHGYTLDLRSYVEANLDEATIDDWAPAQYRAFFLDNGMQFGLPKYHGALALYYNKDLFDTYGVKYPTAQWTYDDYVMAMRRLTHDRDNDSRTDLWGSMIDISWDRLQIHVNSWGGHLVDLDDPTHCVLNDPKTMDAFEWVRARMWDDKVMATFLNVQNMSTRSAFINERLAMVEEGSWALKDILVGANFRFGVVPFPKGPAYQVTLATTDGFGIYAKTKQPEASWQLVRFLIGKEYGRAMAKANLLQPARASVVNDWIHYIRAEFPEKTEDVDISAFADGHRKGYSVTAEIPPNMAEVQQIVYAAWDSIFTLGKRPLAHMKEVCRQIQQLSV